MYKDKLQNCSLNQTDKYLHYNTSEKEVNIIINSNNGSEKLRTKNTATSGKLITALYALYVRAYISCTCFSGRGAASEKFGCKSVDDNTDGLSVYSIVQVGGGGCTWDSY